MQENRTIKTFNKVKGSVGEKLACGFLQNKNYKILEKNYKNFLGEIDVICLDNKNKQNPIYIFVEVKFRNSSKFGMPREAITKTKQATIKKVATYYLKVKNLYEKVSVRFDCIEILAGTREETPEINYIENAF